VRFGRRRALAGAALALLLAGAVVAGPLAVEVDGTTGLPRIVKGGEALTAGYAMWGANWAWGHVELTARDATGGETRIDGRVDSLGMGFDSTVRQASPQVLQWRWNFVARADVPKAVGGGVVFRFDEAMRRALGDPVLLAGQRGWRWGRDDGERVEMRFDPPLASMHLERGNAGEIRAFFYADAIAAGARTTTATLTVAGGAVIRPSFEQRIGLGQRARWPAVSVDWARSPIDLSFLNEADRPAGRRGPVRVAGERLVYADGEPARFWGTNLSAYAIFATPREQVCPQARRLARLGFNLVRLHHHDSPWADPNVFGSRAASTTGPLAEGSMDRIDRWVRCLRDEGIRIWIDLHVGRQMKPSDGIEHFNELVARGNDGDLKGFNYVNTSLQQAMDRFAQRYLEHRNPHTGLRYIDDPAVMGVLVTNENDITHHFGNKLLSDKGVPRHWQLLKAAADDFARRHRLPADRVSRTWEHGPSKLFLNDLERSVNAAAVERLRALGLKAPIATTNFWGDSPLSSLPALTAGDLIDGHAYGRQGELDRDPQFKPTVAHWLAVGQVAGLPCTVSEWNLHGYPWPDRHALPLYIAATAAHQGWDAVMLYAYAQQAVDGPGKPDNWHAMNDPALMVPMAAAALLYRQGHVREAATTYAYAPSADTLFATLVSPDNSAGLRTAIERGRLVTVMPATPELPWLQPGRVPAGAVVLRDAATSLLAPGSQSVRSDHGELERDWRNDEGRLLVRTPRTQAVSGWLRGTVALPDVTIALSNPHASIAVQSLDAEPIPSSRRLLVTLAAVSMPGPGDPLFVGQPLEGSIRIRAPAGLSLFAPREGGMVPSDLPVSHADGHYTLRFEGRDVPTWLMLQPRGR
jgi:hypothetical protein